MRTPAAILVIAIVVVSLFGCIDGGAYSPVSPSSFDDLDPDAGAFNPGTKPSTAVAQWSAS